MRGKPRTADCTIFAVCLMVEGRIVVMGRRVVRRGEREGKKTEGGSEGVYVSSLWWVRDEVTTGPENMRGVEVGWARNGR